MGDGLVWVVGGILISHLIFIPSVSRHSVKKGKHLHGVSSLGMGKEGNTNRTSTPFLLLFMGLVRRFICKRKSNPLTCKSLLVLGLWGNDDNKYQTNHLGQKIYGSCLCVKV